MTCHITDDEIRADIETNDLLLLAKKYHLAENDELRTRVMELIGEYISGHKKTEYDEIMKEFWK